MQILFILLGILDKYPNLLNIVIITGAVIFLFLLFRRRKSTRVAASSKTVTGTVRQFNASTETLVKSVYNALRNVSRQDNINIQVWRFLLERTDAQGNILPFITVEIKGTVLSGIIAEGHKVEIFDKIVPGQVVTPTKIFNHTANAMVKVVKGYT